MATIPTNGTKIYISSQIDTTVTNNATLYAALTWVELKGVSSIGPIGDKASEIRVDILSENRTRKTKGVYDAGSPTIEFVPIASDPGQLAVIAALAVNGDYAFRVILNDKPAAGTSGTILYFAAQIMEAQRMMGPANNPLKYQAQLGITTAIIEVAAV